MSSSFSGGVPDFYTAAGLNGRAIIPNNNSRPQQLPYRSPISGISTEPSSQISHRRLDLMGKRSLAEFQAQQQYRQLFQQQNEGLGVGVYLRNVKPKMYQQQASPVSPLSPVSFSSVSSEIASADLNSASKSISTRYGLPIQQQLRPQLNNLGNGGGNNNMPCGSPNLSVLSFANCGRNRVVNHVNHDRLVGVRGESEKVMNRLQELEKQLLDDDDDNNNEESNDSVSVITNSEWSATIQNLIASGQKPVSPSPTSSSSSCSSSSSTSSPAICPKQSLMEAAEAVSEGKNDVAAEILTRLNQVSNVKGTSEQRLTAYMTSALRSRVYPTEHPPPVAELYSKEHTISTHMLHEVSPCFKLGFMAANLAILEAFSDQQLRKLHILDFDIGQGRQYVHLIHALAGKRADKHTISLKITTVADFVTGIDERLKVVGENLKAVANRVGISLNFKVLSLKISDLSAESLCVERGEEVLAVNLAYRLYKLPDESVTTDNLRDELLRRVKGLSPRVVTVVEQEMNANTAPFAARVKDACGYYGALLDSLDATFPKDSPDRFRIEEGLGRRAANSVACEGADRIERCEVFGKWRARLGMAGFQPKPGGSTLAGSIRSMMNLGTRGNPGFTVKEENGGICFGWLGRTLTVSSTWH